MIKALAAFAVFCGALLIFGGLISTDRADRLALRVHQQPRLLTITAQMPDADDRYRWLSVYGCSADVGEYGATCTGVFERESSMDLDGTRRYAIVAWRDLPGGTMQITAMAFDADRRVLAVGRTVVFRGDSWD